MWYPPLLWGWAAAGATAPVSHRVTREMTMLQDCEAKQGCAVCRCSKCSDILWWIRMSLHHTLASIWIVFFRDLFEKKKKDFRVLMSCSTRKLLSSVVIWTSQSPVTWRIALGTHFYALISMSLAESKSRKFIQIDIKWWILATTSLRNNSYFWTISW
jgi:hypothetical protein